MCSFLKFRIHTVLNIFSQFQLFRFTSYIFLLLHSPTFFPPFHIFIISHLNFIVHLFPSFSDALHFACFIRNVKEFFFIDFISKNAFARIIIFFSLHYFYLFHLVNLFLFLLIDLLLSGGGVHSVVFLMNFFKGFTQMDFSMSFFYIHSFISSLYRCIPFPFFLHSFFFFVFLHFCFFIFII